MKTGHVAGLLALSVFEASSIEQCETACSETAAWRLLHCLPLLLGSPDLGHNQPEPAAAAQDPALADEGPVGSVTISDG